MTVTRPQNAVLMTRISDARNGDERGVADQEADERALAERLGWGVGRVIVENDTSAYKRKRTRLPDGSYALRTDRPGFREALDLLATGQADGLIAYDLDRACRDPRDLEDLIDVVEARSPRVPVESVTGSLKLANDADVTMARVLVAVANKSSRDTGRRVARARLRQAMEGAYGGGRRPYGFESDGCTQRPDEVAEIVRAADALLAGVSLRQVTLSLRNRSILTVTGRPWTPEAVRDMLKRPRNAGIATYKGEEVGRGKWDPVLPEEQWRAVLALLNDPKRRTTPGNTPRWLGSGLYVCGLCGNIMRVQSPGKRRPTYRCRTAAHLMRHAPRLDEYVEEVLVQRLSEPDVASRLVRSEGLDTTAAETEAAAIRVRLTEAGDLWENGTLTAAEYKIRAARLRERLAEVEAQLSTELTRSPIDDVVGADDVRAAWDSLDLGRKRAILQALVVVTVLPAPRGRRPSGAYFDPDSVRFTWR
jgi:site-specific DNA recombinase